MKRQSECERRKFKGALGYRKPPAGAPQNDDIHLSSSPLIIILRSRTARSVRKIILHLFFLHERTYYVHVVCALGMNYM